MRRRELLAAGMAGIALGTIDGFGFPASAGAAPGRMVTYLTISRHSKLAFARGRPMAGEPEFRAALPAAWDGPVSMVTRMDEDGGNVRRRVFPVEEGHEVAVSPDRRRAVLTGQNGRHICTLDPQTLEMESHAAAHGDDGRAGGHALFLPDGGPLLVAERRAYAPYEGAPERHFGRVTVRDPATLKVLEVHSSHGVAPHEINLLDDGRHLAIANYGTTLPAEGVERGPTLPLVEPSLTVIDIRDGRLAYRWAPPKPEFELRHLAAARADRIFVLQNRRKPFEEVQALMDGREQAYYPDVETDGFVHAPAPVLRFDLGRDGPPAECAPETGIGEMGRGQSIVYDAAHDEAIGAFRMTHRLIVFDGATGRVKLVVRTDRLGLRDPAGIALHPDGEHYVVSGDREFVYVFRRGAHELVRERCIYETLFGHAHLTAA